MQHVIRPEPPWGLIVVLNLVALVGLVLLPASDRFNVGPLRWIGAGLVILTVAALARIGWLWHRAKLVVELDDEGVTASSAAGSARVNWSEIEAVTQADSEIRLRRRGEPAVVVQLPSRANPALVELLADDLRDALDRSHSILTDR